jgi:membrane-associated phospholipid phosphatase
VTKVVRTVHREAEASAGGGADRRAGTLTAAGLACLACAAAYAISSTTAVGRSIDAAVVLQHPDSTWSSAADVADDLNAIANVGAFALVAVLILSRALRNGRRADLVPAVVLMLIAAPISSGAKRLLGRLDPLGQEHARELGVAFFPSGHAAAIMSLCLASVLLARPRSVHRRTAAAGACAALLGVSIVLGYSHHPSDVIGGYLIATSLALVLTTLRPPSWAPATGVPAGLAAGGIAVVAMTIAAALIAGGGTRPAIAVALVSATGIALPVLFVVALSGRGHARRRSAAISMVGRS